VREDADAREAAAGAAHSEINESVTGGFQENGNKLGATMGGIEHAPDRIIIPRTRTMMRITLAVPSRWPLLVLGILLVVAAGGGATLGYFLKFDLPDVRALEDYTPPLMTRVLAHDGALVDTFAQQRRIFVEYSEIPESFRKALIATEDSRFYDHTGIDIRGIFRAAWHDLTHMRLAQGASTLTQQLARGLFLNPEKIWRRKFQEMVLALEIERTYSKEEILKFYCNQVYMGHGQYGLGAATRYYFAKTPPELTLEEAALLAGLIQRPEALSPIRNPERALKRRNHVLRRVLLEGWISPEEAEAAASTPMVLASRRPQKSLAPYFVEEVRRSLQARLGETSVYQAGLEVRTTVDRRLQDIANRSVELGLRQLDKRQGWRGVERRIPEDADPSTWENPEWDDGIQIGAITDGVVVSARGDGNVDVRVGPYSGLLTAQGVRWTRRGQPSSFLDPGDLIRVQVQEVTPEGEAALSLEQEPVVEAALVAIEPQTGAVRALVGGFDYERSEFDRAVQARRQTGSAFKPFVYAAALGEGWTPADRLLDEPTVFLDARTLEPYQPENYGDKYYGVLTLRKALEKSINIATVKLITRLGYRPVIDIARRLGISSELRPYPSLALGSFEVNLLELTSAYGTFGNQGVRVEPHLVSEVLKRDGTVLESVQPSVHDAVSPEIAYLMNRLLEGVISDGTGRAAAHLGRPLAGKTGTTDEYTDAWFIGYTPDLAVGVWVGFDIKRSLGTRETGALAALPIWRAFMEAAYEGRPPQDFPRPPGIVDVAIHRDTGLLAHPAAGCSPVVAESFLQGTEPTRYCSPSEHARLKLPYPFHHYDLNDRGELEIPWNRLDALVAEENGVSLSAGGERLEILSSEGFSALAVRRQPEAEPEELPEDLLERLAAMAEAAEQSEEEEEDPRRYDPEAWLGKDGRRPRVQLLRD
jgi:penicillin-binding protein 1A